MILKDDQELLVKFGDDRTLVAELVIQCSVPSKKNQMRRTGKGGRTALVYKSGVREKMTEIQMYILKCWGNRKCVVHPEIEVEWFYTDASQDRDGIWTTVLDAMKKQGVIFDDSISYFNGRVTLLPAQRVTHPRDVRMVVRVYSGWIRL